MDCRYCAAPLAEGSEVCPVCGKTTAQPGPRRSRVLAGILALTLGIFGAHNFYLGHRPKGLTQLVMRTVGGIFSVGVSTIAVGIWALAEAVAIFSGKREM